MSSIHSRPGLSESFRDCPPESDACTVLIGRVISLLYLNPRFPFLSHTTGKSDSLRGLAGPLRAGPAPLASAPGAVSQALRAAAPLLLLCPVPQSQFSGPVPFLSPLLEGTAHSARLAASRPVGLRPRVTTAERSSLTPPRVLLPRAFVGEGFVAPETRRSELIPVC